MGKIWCGARKGELEAGQRLGRLLLEELDCFQGTESRNRAQQRTEMRHLFEWIDKA